MRSRSLSVEQERDLTAGYIARRPVKVLAYEFGISSRHVTNVALRNGARYRNKNCSRNGLNGREATMQALFRQGLDTVTIAHRLSVKEALVANMLARLRDEERRQ